uniref:ATP synthase F0 subunit 8 n=1 Tax=Leucorrhinia albifrons TaxID=213666 RepID=UPI00226CA427|nr:ATP synthase F0 subunit 8 [Leucorrhinia albifrons]UZI00205.1 ATP synthase F0 subunit 8 [Leucorrhinia albifrons]
MPQMAPMSWVILFMFFSVMLLTINIMNYYLYTPKFVMLMENKKINIKTKNWMW